MRLVMRDGLTFVLAGAVAGILGALASTRVIRSMLFDTTPTDATTFIAVPIVLTLGGDRRKLSLGTACGEDRSYGRDKRRVDVAATE